MTDLDPHKHSYNLRDLKTGSVTIFPHNAQISRVVDDIALKPGPNLVEIVGLSPTVDEGSIKVDGHGKASISGLTVELVRNPLHFRDVYDSDSDDDLDQPDAFRLPDKPKELQELEAKVRTMKADIGLLNHEVQTANDALQGLKQLTGTVGKENISAKEISLRVELFQETSKRHAKQAEDAKERKFPLEEELPKLILELQAAQRAYERATKAQRREMKLAESKWRRACDARKKARKERFDERSKFWPRNVFKISVMVEQLADDVESTSSNTEPPEQHMSLSLYYVTGAAAWTPAYDVNIESESRSGTLIYRAEISNHTSETWQDARVTLSTTQTSFSGLQDPLPELVPWNIRLLTNKGFAGATALLSAQERHAHFGKTNHHTKGIRLSKDFGCPSEENPYWTPATEGSFFSTALPFAPPPAPPPAVARGGSLFGSAPGNAGSATQDSRSAARFSSASANVVPLGAAPAGPSTGFGASSAFGGTPGAASPSKDESIAFGVSDEEQPRSQSRKEAAGQNDRAFRPVSIPEAAWEESGLTAIWELKGQHTISPTSKRHRHRISIIDLADLELKHVCVPKLRTDAFLTVRLRNPSGQTILTGDAGFTLDGAFIGTKELKRIAPGDFTTVSLGVDETIVVEYTKPSEKRNLTSGLINKDASAGYQRCVMLRHTKSPEDGTARPMEITVRDQIPVPMDERIRLDLLKPNGLRNVGDTVRAGEVVKDETTASSRGNGRGSVSTVGSVRQAGAREEPWGRATANLNKHGKIEWTVKLNPGQKVALPLEYDLRFPASETVASD